MQWKKTIRHLATQHISKKQACEIIEKSSGVPAQIVAVYTAPHNYKPPSHYRKYSYPHYGNHNTNEYDLKYKNLIRHIDDVLPQLFNGNSELSLTEMTEGIESNVGISMRESTLEKLIGKYEGNAPLIKTELGHYQLNQDFYQPK